MSSKGKFYMTTAIAYTSGKPHIGNTYEIVLADAIARFRRQEGYDVYFQTGTDEHGQKIQEKAEKAGITPKEYVDNVAGEVKRIWDLMNTSYDNFVRTTDEDHEKQVKKIFKKLYDQGDIYKVKTFSEITKLERNGMFVYESVPGTAVMNLNATDTGLTFQVEGPEDAQITVEMEPDTEYEVFIEQASTGKMKTNLGGKLSFSVELGNAARVEVKIVKC